MNLVLSYVWQAASPRLIEIIPLMCTPAVGGQHPVFPLPSPLRGHYWGHSWEHHWGTVGTIGALLGAAAAAEGLMGLAVGSPLVSILGPLRAHHMGGHNVMAWWLQHPLLVWQVTF